jgi:hypothetical protein
MRGEYNLDPNSKSALLVFDGANLERLLEFISFDYRRFLFSSVESFREAVRRGTPPKAVSWRLVTLYYAAYYASQAVARSTGRFLARVDAPTAKFVADLASALSLGAAPTAGYYLVEIEQQGLTHATVTMHRLDDKKAGGAHEAFWGFFDKFLTAVAELAVVRRFPGSADVIANVDDLQRLLRAMGNSRGNWLSVVRNGIAYRHEYGGWYPYGISRGDMDELNRVAVRETSAIRLDVDPAGKPLQAFSRGCQMLVNVALEGGNWIASLEGSAAFKRRYSSVRAS